MPNFAEQYVRDGLSFIDQGNLDAAIAAFQQALRIQPDSFAAHFHHANTLALQGKHALALASFRDAVHLKPDHAEALTALGVALARQGHLPEAIDTLRRATTAGPTFAKAHLNLGVALAESKKLDEAAASLRRALELKPDYTEAHFNLGNVLSELGKREEAVPHFERVLQLKPDHVDALNNFGLNLVELGRFGTAVIVLKQALRLRPEHVEAWNNLGLALAGQGRFDDAITAYEKTLALNPRHVDAHNNLGSAYKDLGRMEEAVACYQQAIWLQPDNASSHWNRALAWLQMGDFEHGWQEYEWRWRRKNVTLPNYRQPRWDGSPLAGRTILLHAEQGLGDMIQFIRYAPLIAQTGGKVVVACPRSLHRLFSRMEGIDQLVHEGEDLPPFDVHAPLMSLPQLMGTTPASIPARTPYLAAEPDLLEHWRQCFAGSYTFKIGIAWQGNPRHRLDRHRSIGLAKFAPLAAIPNVQMFSLQQGAGTGALKDAARDFPVIELFDDPAVPLVDFAEVAAVMHQLDLVVTPDTAIAHLAGALAVPVCVTLAAVADWRWLMQREDTPWYPTMRLFRQTTLGDWVGVFERLADEARVRMHRRSLP
jgi:tetratricopeptide (TPR) repeat protein